jgi:hypothetical protein
MHVNHMLVQCLKSTMDHSLSKWSSGRFGKRAAIRLYEHEIVPIRFGLESCE